MASQNYRQAFKSAIARIYHANGSVVGAGFLVAEGRLLTCAHVVTAALGIPTTTKDTPMNLVELDFPLIAPGQKVKAKVAFWLPVLPENSTSPQDEDIAGLEIEGDLPAGCQSARLVSAEALWGHPFQIFGFPIHSDNGIWATGVIRDGLANGWIQIEDIKAQGQTIQPGFSGAPIWDETVEGVVGMAVAADKKREETKTAFMIPTRILSKDWAELDKSVQLSQPKSVAINNNFNFKQIQLSEKQKYWSVLVERWKRAYNQMSSTLNQSDIPNLEQQIKTIEQGIINIENEIRNLTNH